MNRLITSLIQLTLAIPAIYMGRIVWEMTKEDFRELDDN